MTFLKKLFGKDPATLREEAEAAVKAADWGSAKLAYQGLVEALKDGPQAERDEARKKLDEC